MGCPFSWPMCYATNLAVMSRRWQQYRGCVWSLSKSYCTRLWKRNADHGSTGWNYGLSFNAGSLIAVPHLRNLGHLPHDTDMALVWLRVVLVVLTHSITSDMPGAACKRRKPCSHYSELKRSRLQFQLLLGIGLTSGFSILVICPVVTRPWQFREHAMARAFGFTVRFEGIASSPIDAQGCVV